MQSVQSFLKLVRGTVHTHELLFDCGSTETRVFFDGKNIYQEPTCVAVHKESDAVVAFGSKAVTLLGKVAHAFTVSFPIQYGEIVSPRLFSLYVQALLKSIALKNGVISQLLGFTAKVVVPTQLSPVQKNFFEAAFKEAGFRSVQLVPQSQTLLWQLGDGGSSESFCVFDFGGQKTELAIFALQELVAVGTIPWGGVQFTEIVQAHVRKQYQCQISWHVAEQVKKDVVHLLTFSGTKRGVARKTAVRGKDVVTQAGKTVVVESSDFTEVLGDSVEDLVDAVQFFFSSVPPDLVAACLEQGIHCTGGVSQMVGLSELLEATFSAPIHISSEPTTDSIKGLSSLKVHAEKKSFI